MHTSCAARAGAPQVRNGTDFCGRPRATWVHHIFSDINTSPLDALGMYQVQDRSTLPFRRALKLIDQEDLVKILLAKISVAANGQVQYKLGDIF